MERPWAHLLSDFIRLFYPPYCVACNGPLVKGEDWICTSCMMELPRPKYHLYRENPAFMRLAGRLPLDFAATLLLFVRGGRVQRLLHVLKYHQAPELAFKLGEVFGTDLLESGLHQKVDVIIPVPLHWLRLKKRGYNQSAEFARGLSAITGLPLDEQALVRTRPTATQTRKNRLLRWQNMEHAFSIKNPEAIEGKRVLLTDDVITTGATLESCAQVLVNAGALSISVAGIAYAGG